ncbi:MAG: hypothetical protein JETT_1911 [Candidatus Jettenia ecosi]|uniref:Uncharacterized protein n=1 Tax=Candidatus Jettenia ecosi TaxID=2494326 RepID=A0A533QGM5_9BACT|nr:MAG: hypothetical protein JETT_1911 [Candidatus Jettenia ecosi]
MVKSTIVVLGVSLITLISGGFLLTVEIILSATFLKPSSIIPLWPSILMNSNISSQNNLV